MNTRETYGGAGLLASRFLGLEPVEAGHSSERARRLVVLASFCSVGSVAALLSLPFARTAPEAACLVAFFFATAALPILCRLRVPETVVVGAAFLILLAFLIAMACLPDRQEARHLFWFALLPLGGGLVMSGHGIALGGLLGFVGAISASLSFHGVDRAPLDVLVDALVFVGSITAMTAVYELLYEREHTRVRHMLALEAESRRALEQSERELRTILDSEPACVMQLGRDGRLIDVNAAGMRFLGATSVEALRNLDIIGLVSPEYREGYWRAIEAVFAGKRTEDDLRLDCQDGSSYWVQQHGAPLYDDNGRVRSMLAVVRDITASWEAEQERLRRNRIEAIGTLAGGVAHDLNNVLTPLRLGLEEIRADGDEPEVLDMMDAGLDHASSMVRQLVDFARGAGGERSSVNISVLMGETEALLESTLPKRIQLAVEVASDLPRLSSDRTQIQQVLLNLCVNARDAMPEGGRLAIEVFEARIDRPEGIGAELAEPGRYLVLRVSDEGAGISEERLGAIFEPFYTTKSPQKGTGLGLSTVLGIVRGHGGFITVESELGVGTTMTVHLPFVPSPSQSTGDLSPRFPTVDAHNRLVLLVDDDEMILRLVARILEGGGYRVRKAADGTEAWALVEAGERPDVVVTDLHMPHLDGLQLIERLRRTAPELPILLMSGRLTERDDEPLRAIPGLVVLEKPFGRADFFDAFERALRATSASSPPKATELRQKG